MAAKSKLKFVLNRGKLVNLFDLHGTSPSKIAKVLGVSRQYIYAQMKRQGIELKKRVVVDYTKTKITPDN